MATERLSPELRKHNHSLTKQRQAVFDYLLTEGPVSMSNLIKNTNQINRASVYRTVELFERLGFIRRVPSGWKYTLELSDVFTAHHHHIQCRNCGRIADITDNKQLDDYASQVAQKHGFSQIRHELEISGLCANCSS